MIFMHTGLQKEMHRQVQKTLWPQNIRSMTPWNDLYREMSNIDHSFVAALEK